MSSTRFKLRPNSSEGIFIACVVVCFFAIGFTALRGVRWDEHYEFAQVFTGAVIYDEGHPLKRAVFNSGNVQIMVAGLLMWLWPSPSLVNGAFNVVQIAATVLPVYICTLVLSRRASISAVAALVVLFSYADTFHSVYPIHTWPGSFHSTGQIGRGFALFVLALLIGGYHRAGGLLFGLMPIVHIAHMPPLLAWVVLWYGWLAWRGKYAYVRQFIMSSIMALAVCGIYLGVGMLWAIPDPATGVYASSANSDAVWKGLIAMDPHRALPGGRVSYSNAAVAVACVLSIAACALTTRRRRSLPWLALSLYVYLNVAIVVSIMAIHALLGEAMPYFLLAWMPYRLTNHLVILWAAIAVATLVRQRIGTAVQLIIAGVASWPILQSALRVLAPENFVMRYVDSGSTVIFFMTGATLASILNETTASRVNRNVRLIACSGLFLALLGLHQFGLACAILGALVYAVLRRTNQAMGGRSAVLISTAVCVAVVAVGHHQLNGGRHLPLNAGDTALISALRDGGPHDQIVVPPTRYLTQGKTDHPVLMDGPLPLWISYMPSVGPSIQNVMSDIYGIRYDGPSRNWQKVWEERSAQEWRWLGTQYDFEWVLSPVTLTLGDGKTVGLERLYRVETSRYEN